MKTILSGICVLSAVAYAIGFLRGITKLIRREGKSNDNLKQLNPYYTFKEHLEGTKYSEQSRSYIALALSVTALIGVAMFVLPYTRYGSENLDSEFRKKQFTTYYYANFQPEDSESKFYKLIVEIEYDSKDAYDGWSGVNIKKAYFPNGGYVWIDDVFDPVWFGEKAEVWDSDGRHWDVELVNEKPDDEILHEWKVN